MEANVKTEEANMDVQPTTLAFEQRYDDCSGVEFGVRLTDDAVQFESMGEKVDFPIGQLDWLRECLSYIAGVIDEREVKYPEAA
jgi:hypothetical protein